MFRRIILILTLAALLLAASVGIVFGLLNSEAGTRWLAARMAPWVEGGADWQSMDGSLLGSLQLRGLRITQPGMLMTIQSLKLDWQPAGLLQGRIHIDGMRAEGVRIVLSPTQAVDTGEPFDPAALELPVDVSFNKIRLRDLQIVQGDEPAQLIREIKLDGQLTNGELSIEQLGVVLDRGSLALSGSSALSNPMPVNLHLAWGWNLPVADTQTAASSTQSAPVSGELALEGRLAWSEALQFELKYNTEVQGVEQLNPDLPTQIEVSGILAGQYQGDGVTLDQLQLSLADMGLTMQGRLDFSDSLDPAFDVSLQWSSLQWPLVGASPDVSSSAGKFLISGNASDYGLELEMDLAGAQIPPGSWSGEGRGDLSHLELTRLHGSVIGGNLTLSGPLEWSPVPRWALRVKAEGLDPAQISADFPGQLAIAASTTGQIDPERGTVASVELEHLSGTVMDRPIRLTARASLANDTVQVDSLLLESAGNHISLNGQLSAEALALAWQLQAPAMGELLEGASGAISGSGKVMGSPEFPLLEAQLRGESLLWESYSIPTLKATVAAGLAAEDPLRVDLAIGPVEDDAELLLKSLLLQVQGTASAHKLKLELATPAEQLAAHLEGGVNPDFNTWEGMLTQLDVQSEDYGRWRLPQKSALVVSGGAITLGNTCLKDDTTAAQLCAGASWDEAGKSTVKAEIQALPAELLNPVVSGIIEGGLEGALSASGAITASASVRLSEGLVQVETGQGTKHLSHGGGKLALNIDGKGLRAKLNFAAPEQGKVNMNVQLPGLGSWPMADKQPLRGRLTASLPDLSSAPAWMPELSSSAGQLQADMTLGGTLARPEFLGNATLTQAAADIPLAGLELRQIELRMNSNSTRREVLDISGSMQSGPGSVSVSGWADMDKAALALTVEGERLQVYNTEDARVLLSPDLDITWSDELLKLRGQLLVPKADITPKLQISPSRTSQDPGAEEIPGQIIGPSGDVVVINAPGNAGPRALAEEPSFKLDSQVKLILGDAVKVNTLGFISQITGAVAFTNAVDQAQLIPMAKGRLSLDDGTFRAFGQDLHIETGQLIFSDVPATEPELNVRAVRWIDNDPKVTAAGVLVTGSVTDPTLELFSRPELEVSEVQSYLLTGRSSADKSNVLSIGTYLTPRIYVGYGYNLIQETNEFNSLFSITPRYGVGANLGEADNNINMTFTHEN